MARSRLWSRDWIFLVFTAAASGACGDPALADEGGSSFWILGSYASQAAVASPSGLSLDMTYYSASANADSTVSFARHGRIQEGISTSSNYLMLTPSYTFEEPILGAQFQFGVTLLMGNYRANASATLIGAFGAGSSGASSDSVTAFGDLSPLASLKWNRGVNNFMAYATANVPVGNYDVGRQASIGLGYWALDGGLAYTYFDQDKGHEISAVLGFTYNFMNSHTLYQSGIDMHLEMSASQYVTKEVSLGIAGYLYDQLTADTGAGAALGAFKSRVAGAGPQFEYDFAFGRRSASLTARGYYEFAAQNRPKGWNAWLTLTIALGTFSEKTAH